MLVLFVTIVKRSVPSTSLAYLPPLIMPPNRKIAKYQTLSQRLSPPIFNSDENNTPAAVLHSPIIDGPFRFNGPHQISSFISVAAPRMDADLQAGMCLQATAMSAIWRCPAF